LSDELVVLYKKKYGEGMKTLSSTSSLKKTSQVPKTPNGDYVFDTSRFGLLGRGAHAVVVRARHNVTGKAVAVKIVNKNYDPGEAHLLMQLHHPNIVRMFGIQRDEKRMYFISELCRGGELFDLIAEHGPLPLGLAKHISRQLCEGIAYLHGRGVTHWDLKPENLLLTEAFQIKIADFGFAVLGTDSMPERPRGTIPYMAPEFVQIWRFRRQSRDRSSSVTGSSSSSSSSSLLSASLSSRHNGSSGNDIRPLAAETTMTMVDSSSCSSSRENKLEITTGDSKSSGKNNLLSETSALRKQQQQKRQADNQNDITLSSKNNTSAFSITKKQHQQHQQALDPQRADMWSIGIVMHCILAGTFPFTSPTEADRNFRLHKQNAWKPSFPEEDDDCIKLVLKLLEIDPFKRPKAGECLDSQWLRLKPTKTAEEMLKNINKEKTQIENHAEEGVQERAAVVSKAAAATTTTTTTTATVGMKRQRRQIVRDDDEETMENNDNHHHSSNGSAADGETNGETIHQQEKKRRLGGYVACKCETPLAALAVEIEEEQKAMTAGAIKAAAAAPTPTIREGKGEPRKGDFTTADTHTTIDDSKEKQFQNSSSETSPLYHNSAHGDCQGEEEGGRKTGDRPTTKAPPTTATKSSNPRNEKHLPVKRLGWILPGKSVEKSNKFLDQIGQAVAEIGFDAELDTDDFFVVGRDNETDQDMFIVTLFEQQVKGKESNLLLDVQRLNLPPLDFNEVYRSLR